MTVRRFASIIILAVAAMLGGPTTALAQSALRPETIRATSLDDAQKAEVAKFVADLQAGLLSDNPSEVKRSRDELLKPLLSDKNISVAFRQEFSSRVEPTLKQALKSAKEIHVVSALRIAGEMATPAGTDLVEPLRGDSRASVRYCCVAAWLRTFEAMAHSAPAVPDGRALALVGSLAKTVADEQDARILDAHARALTAATGINSLRTEGYVALARSFAQRMAKTPADKVDGPTTEAFLRAIQAMDDGFKRRKIDNADAQIVGVKKDGPAFALASSAISLVVSCVEAGVYSPGQPDARELPFQLATSSLDIIALTDATRGAAAATKVARDWRDGKTNDKSFTDAVKKVIGK